MIDHELGPEPFTEQSASLNPKLKGTDIRKAFAGADYQLLLVANKFQTGFDQPLLCGMYVDKRLAGIQAVQTLSRLNRAYPGKDTTYVVDFMNQADEVLEAFKTYYATASLTTTTDPNLVLNLRAKLDSAGHYDEHDVDRVVAVEMNPKSIQSDLVKAVEPVVDRVVRQHRAAQQAIRSATERGDGEALKAAKEQAESLVLFKGDMGAYVRLYTFLSQIFDYANTALEKRAIFYRRVLPLLEFGRERDTIDLSKVRLTHYTIHDKGREVMLLRDGASPTLDPLTEAGAGSVQEKQKALLAELIEKVNLLFDGELTDNDKLVYVNNVILGKLLESPTLATQAANNTKEQFADSPDIDAALTNAAIDASEAHDLMSQQLLGSPKVHAAFKEILLNGLNLWEELRKKSG